ncbi:transcriptional regulator [Alsobacter metallidurans]|uniref:Transcriptional regulator n=2 Tax=Alsobacter metallidurans TaxID=340221 RepID=A0A917I4U4_9HYPH|nr:transcriptional regulator [Alsobacter metallidurans]
MPPTMSRGPGSDVLIDRSALPSEAGDAPARPEAGDTAKRRQIIDGARALFLERGFDSASMGEIARRAGVSKGTLYVYFENKEQLFCAIMDEERRTHLDRLGTLDPDRDTRETLIAFGRALVTFILKTKTVAAMRAAIAIAERMPEVGRAFYARGPATTISTMATYLDRKVAQGELVIADTRLAATQLLDLYQTSLVRPALFGLEPSDAEFDERVETVVTAGVDLFLRAHKAG